MGSYDTGHWWKLAHGYYCLRGEGMNEHSSGFLEICETDLFILSTFRMLPTLLNESRPCEPVHLLNQHRNRTA